MRNAALGLICAAALALALSDITIFGIAIWKIELAIAGALLFVTAGRKSS
jgi:membrane-bound ClpP family serine protease